MAARLPDLAGLAEPPARLQGDLWGATLLAGADGRPWLIDPASYGGHRELDLAMLRPSVRRARPSSPPARRSTPLADGHEERVELWQVLPLLLHAVLVGGGYGASAVAAMRRYV